MLMQWNEWKTTEQYDRCVNWLKQGNFDGELWAAFVAGWEARAKHQLNSGK